MTKVFRRPSAIRCSLPGGVWLGVFCGLLVPVDARSDELDESVARRAQYEQHALTYAGDADRGRKLFGQEEVTKCLICHKVGEQGGEVGPDLSKIGGKFDRPHLIESLLEPSRQIVEGYRSTTILLNDGRVLTGIVKEQSDERLRLLDADGKSQEIRQQDIDQQRVSALSLMPVGLQDQLTPAEFTDVIAYLESLRPGGSPTPGAGIIGPITLPDGFTIRTVATGLTGLTALETTADGRIFVCEQSGSLRVIRDGKLLDEPFVTLPVEHYWERGLIGVTVHPDFPETPYIYVCWVAGEPYPHHRISRFTADGDIAVEGSELVLLKGDDQRQLGGNVPAGHQGGGIHFSPDGKLYIGLGEQTAATPSQKLDSLLGKILRINPDGSIPDDNPFLGETSGKYQAIWARGLRNPYTFAFRDGTGELFINDVGGKYEEINIGTAGSNYGWPTVDHGPVSDDRFVGPIYIYPQASIAGGDFLPDQNSWPEKYQGKYFFADYVHGWIKTLDPDHHDQVDPFATGLRRPSDLRFGPDGALYVLLRNAWVVDDKFQSETGTILEIRHPANETARN